MFCSLQILICQGEMFPWFPGWITPGKAQLILQLSTHPGPYDSSTIHTPTIKYLRFSGMFRDDHKIGSILSYFVCLTEIQPYLDYV